MAATNDYVTLYVLPAGPCRNALAVTPSDSTDLANASRALYIGVAGDVTVTPVGGQANVLFKAAPVGILAIAVTRVLATGTAATNIVALW